MMRMILSFLTLGESNLYHSNVVQTKYIQEIPLIIYIYNSISGFLQLKLCMNEGIQGGA